MAFFRTIAKDGVSLPFVFQSAQSASTAPLVSLSFRNKDDDSKAVYHMASIDVYDSGALSGDSSKDGFGTLAISTASNGEVSEVVRFTDDNFVGVNTKHPRANLHVVGSALFEGDDFTVSNGAATFVDTDVNVVGGRLLVNGQEVTGGGGGGGGGSNDLDGVFDYDAPSGLLTVSTLGVPRVFVTGAGYLGVGTSNPASELEVVGTAEADQLAVGSNAAIASAVDPRYALKVVGDVLVDGVLTVSQYVDDTPFITFVDDRLAFQTASNDRFAIDPAGDAEFFGDLSVSSNLTVGGNARVSGDLTVSGHAALSNSDLFITAGGTVGVGTAPDPAFALDVAGGARVSDGDLEVSAGDVTVTAGDLEISSGRLGINKSPDPGIELDVAGDVVVGGGGDLVVTGGDATVAAGDLAVQAGSVAINAVPSAAFALDVAGAARFGGGDVSVTGGDLAVTGGAVRVNDGDVVLESGGDLTLSNGDVVVVNGRIGINTVPADADLDVAGTATFTDDVTVTDGDVALGAGDLLVAAGSIGVRVASPSNELHVGGSVRIDDKLYLGGIAIPDAFPDQIITVADRAGSNLKYIHPHTDTLDPAIAALAIGPAEDFIVTAVSQDVPVFAVASLLDPRSYAVASDTALEFGVEPDARLLLLLSLATGRTDNNDQTVTTTLRMGGAQMGATLNTCHSINNVNNDEHTAFAGGFYSPTAAQTASVRARKVLDPGSGTVSVGTGTKVLGLRFDGSDAYFGQSTGLSTALTTALAPAPIDTVLLADGGSFAADANGFVVAEDVRVLVVGGAATAVGGDLMRTNLEVNGAAANSHDYYTGFSDGPGSVSFAQVLSLAAGDAVRVTNSTYNANVATLESVSLSAGTIVAAEDAAQLDRAVGFGNGVGVGANTFYRVPFDGASVLGASFSQGADSLVVQTEGYFLVFATVSVEDSSGGQAGVNVRLLLDGFTNLYTGACLWDESEGATVPIATAVELRAGSELSLDLTCNQDCTVFDACLCAVRFDNSYPSDPTLLTYGSYYKRAALGSDFQNDTQTFREAFSLLTGEVPAGLYRITFQGQLQRIANRTAEYRLVLDDAAELVRSLARVSGPNDNEFSRVHNELTFLSTGRHKVTLEHRSTVNNTTARFLAGSSLEIYRIR